MSITIENATLLYAQHGEDTALELRAVFAYWREALLYLQARNIDDYLTNGGKGSVRLFLVDTQSGNSIIRLLTNKE